MCMLAMFSYVLFLFMIMIVITDLFGLTSVWPIEVPIYSSKSLPLLSYPVWRPIKWINMVNLYDWNSS